MPLYERLLFFPDRSDPAKVLGLFRDDPRLLCHSSTSVFFKTPDQIKLSGWFFKSSSSARVVLVSHGNGGNLGHRAILASSLLKAGYSVFLYDYEGYGNSLGQPSVRHCIADACAAYDYLVNVEKIAPVQIVGYGESLGSGVTAELSRRRPLAAMVLQSSFPSLTWAAHDRLWYTWLYPNSWFPELDCLAAVRDSTIPLLIIHGRNDPVFSTEYARMIYAQIRYRKIESSAVLCLIDHMGHNLEDSNQTEYLKAMRELLKTL